MTVNALSSSSGKWSRTTLPRARSAPLNTSKAWKTRNIVRPKAQNPDLLIGGPQDLLGMYNNTQSLVTAGIANPFGTCKTHGWLQLLSVKTFPAECVFFYVWLWRSIPGLETSSRQRMVIRTGNLNGREGKRSQTLVMISTIPDNSALLLQYLWARHATPTVSQETLYSVCSKEARVVSTSSYCSWSVNREPQPKNQRTDQCDAVEPDASLPKTPLLADTDGIVGALASPAKEAQTSFKDATEESAELAASTSLLFRWAKSFDTDVDYITLKVDFARVSIPYRCLYIPITIAAEQRSYIIIIRKSFPNEFSVSALP